MTRLTTTLALCTLLAMLGSARPAAGGDDPSIAGAQRDGIQKAMVDFVGNQSVDGTLLHYDPVTGQLLHLRLTELHAGIVKKGDFFVSCADFADPEGVTHDLDFLVLPHGDGYRVNQAIVHSVDGAKRKYHLESRWPSLF